VIILKAKLDDLPKLVGFTAAEAQEAEGATKDLTKLEIGIKTALEDPTIAQYWVLVDENDQTCGSVSAVREWSDWHAGYYWWVQSMYIVPEKRGQGLMTRMHDAVVEEMERQEGLELRLYVHQDNRRAIRAYEKAGFKPSPYEIMVLGTRDRDGR